MFKKAIVRKPCRNMVTGITKARLGLPDYRKALIQHDSYVQALERCGLKVTILDALEAYPDSVFVEDTALLTPYCTIVTNPGAKERKGEAKEMKKFLHTISPVLEEIIDPGTVDAGDVMMAGQHFYIGLSDRTNQEGVNQLIAILEKYGLVGSTVKLSSVLHLKTGISYLEYNNLLATGEFLQKPEFTGFKILEVPHDEAYAANSLWINGSVLVPEGFHKTRAMIETKGYPVIDVDVSEFRKLDGGLSCLSLRF